MEAKQVKTYGKKLFASERSSKRIWTYNGSLWAIFGADNFAYCWGKDTTENRNASCK